MTHSTLIGLEVLKKETPLYFKNKRLGLLANSASVDRNFIHASNIINMLFPGQLRAIFAPQHGYYAEKQDNMIESLNCKEPNLNIPIFSLYNNQSRIPTPDMFQDIDTLIVDIQDVGTRVYTFIYTVSYCMELASLTGKKIVILDRPNPIGGIYVEGNILECEMASFVGRFPIPMRHGLTIGEICRFFNNEFSLGCDLEIIQMKGWQRYMNWTDTGLSWIPPSPNLPTPLSCSVYPGQVIWEGTNLSEGRGTTLPFEQFGSPFINTRMLHKEIKNKIKGAVFRTINFEPTSGKWQGQVCKGFHIHVTDPMLYKPYFASLLTLQLIIRNHRDEFRFKSPPYEYEYQKLPIDLILGSQKIRQKIESLTPIEEIEHGWQKEQFLLCTVVLLTKKKLNMVGRKTLKILKKYPENIMFMISSARV